MKVSVLINNFNYGRFIPECLESLKSQTIPPDEVIFYDDGSTDNSIELVSKYEFVKILSFPNSGDKPSFNQANAINRAFEASSGDIICLLDSDDYFELKKIEEIKNTFESDLNLVMVQDGCSLLYESGKSGVLRPKYNLITPELYRRTKWTAWFNPTSCLSFRRSYLERILPIQKDEFWQVWSDVRLSRIAPYFGTVASINKQLTVYRRHDSNDSSRMNENHKRTLSNQIAHHEYLNRELEKFQFAKINYKISVNYLFFSVKAMLPSFVTRPIIEARRRCFSRKTSN